jgi:hypothetical protein
VRGAEIILEDEVGHCLDAMVLLLSLLLLSYILKLLKRNWLLKTPDNRLSQMFSSLSIKHVGYQCL